MSYCLDRVVYYSSMDRLIHKLNTLVNPFFGWESIIKLTPLFNQKIDKIWWNRNQDYTYECLKIVQLIWDQDSRKMFGCNISHKLVNNQWQYWSLRRGFQSQWEQRWYPQSAIILILWKFIPWQYFISVYKVVTPSTPHILPQVKSSHKLSKCDATYNTRLSTYV